MEVHDAIFRFRHRVHAARPGSEPMRVLDRYIARTCGFRQRPAQHLQVVLRIILCCIVAATRFFRARYGEIRG